MRAQYGGEKSNLKWLQLDTDEPLDYIITEEKIYQKNWSAK